MKLVGSKRAVRSVEFHRKKELERKIRLSIFSIFALALLFGSAFWIRNDFFLISNITISGNESISSEAIQKLVTEKINGFYLGLVPRASVAFYPKNKIKQDLLESVPELASVNLSLSGTKSVEVEVVERVPFALYCSDQCFYMDETGYIYSEAPTFTSGVYTTFSSVPKVESPLRVQFFEEEELSNLSQFLRNVEGLGFRFRTVTKKEGEYAGALIGGMELKWRADQSFEKLFIDLSSFLKDKQLKNLNVSDLLYLDLRIDSKILWVFKDGR